LFCLVQKIKWSSVTDLGTARNEVRNGTALKNHLDWWQPGCFQNPKVTLNTDKPWLPREKKHVPKRPQKICDEDRHRNQLSPLRPISLT